MFLKSVLEGVFRMTEKIIEIIKYGFCGFVTTAINLILFWILEKVGLHYLVANVVSYIIAVLINYFLNKKFVFYTQGKTRCENCYEILKYFGVRLFSLLIDSTLFYIIVDTLKVNVYVGRIALSIAIIMMTFVINKVFVFRKGNDR